jgi:hypothetical protein
MKRKYVPESAFATYSMLMHNEGCIMAAFAGHIETKTFRLFLFIFIGVISWHVYRKVTRTKFLIINY